MPVQSWVSVNRLMLWCCCTMLLSLNLLVWSFSLFTHNSLLILAVEKKRMKQKRKRVKMSKIKWHSKCTRLTDIPKMLSIFKVKKRDKKHTRRLLCELSNLTLYMALYTCTHTHKLAKAHPSNFPFKKISHDMLSATPIICLMYVWIRLNNQFTCINGLMARGIAYKCNAPFDPRCDI